MKILENNNSKTVVCPWCRSVLEIERSDIKGQDRKSRLNANGGICAITVSCGACSKNINLGYSEQDIFETNKQ